MLGVVCWAYKNDPLELQLLSEDCQKNVIWDTKMFYHSQEKRHGDHCVSDIQVSEYLSTMESTVTIKAPFI